MIERGNTRHTPRQDDELKHESQGLVQGLGGAGHVEEWRQTEGLPDDTDSPEAAQALGVDGLLQDAPETVAPGGGDDVSVHPAPDADADTDTNADADGSVAIGPDGDFATADPLVYSTETSGDPAGDEPGADGNLETADQNTLGADALGSDSPGSRPITPEAEGANSDS